ncbi:MAG: membrane protein insertase YidC, partial [Polaromonas sp.]
MNDIRRTILWVIFGFSMVLLWDQWQVFNGHKPTFFPSSSQTAKAPAGAASSAAAGSSAAVPSSMTPGVAATPGAVPTGAPSALPAASKERVVVNTDVLTLTFDSEGGTLVRSVFSKYKDLTDKDTGFVLLDDGADRVYVAQTGLIAGASGGALPTHKTVMTLLPGERSLKDGQNELQVKFESADVGGVKLVKTYTLKRGSYDIAVRHDIINTGTAAVTPQLYLQLVRDGNAPVNNIPAPKLLHYFGMEHMPSFYSTFTGPAVYTEAKKYQKVEFKTIESNKVDVEKEASNGYVAMVQHYFASAWILPDGVKRDLFLRKVDTNLYAVGMIAPLESIAPGASKTVESSLFVGPQEEKTLEAITPGLELVKDYGWLTILAKPLYWLLDKLHSFIQNWGWS